jgi:hypothetical protein
MVIGSIQLLAMLGAATKRAGIYAPLLSKPLMGLQERLG